MQNGELWYHLWGFSFWFKPTDQSESLRVQRTDRYLLASYPQLKQYIAGQVNFAREQLCSDRSLGRRRYLKDINSQNSVVRGAAERNAINAPIQGSAADIIKLAMIKIHQIKAENWQSKMLLQVDELVFDVLKSEK